MSSHQRTDPACTEHRPPRGRISQWWYDRNRGRACMVCDRERQVRSFMQQLDDNRAAIKRRREAL